MPVKNRLRLLRAGAAGGYRARAPEPEDAGPAPVPLGAPHALDTERDRLVYGDGGRLFVVEGLLAGRPVTRSLRVSWVSTISALLLRGDIVYVGGQAPFGLLLGLVELAGPLSWKNMELPDGLFDTGKGIDGLVLHGDRLIVVDDLVFPWYFLVFDAREPAAPRPLGVRMFHGRVTSVASGGGLLALRQTQWQFRRSLSPGAGLRRQVKLFALPGLEERGVVEGHEGAPEWEDVHGIPGVAFAEERMLLAQGELGLSVLPVAGLAEGSVSLAELSAREVRIPVAGGAVVGVIPADGGRAFAVVRGRSGLDGVLVRY